jgi:hypothetical protein
MRCGEIKQEKENKRRVGMVIVFRLFNLYDAGNLEGSIPPDLAL